MFSIVLVVDAIYMYTHVYVSVLWSNVLSRGRRGIPGVLHACFGIGRYVDSNSDV